MLTLNERSVVHSVVFQYILNLAFPPRVETFSRIPCGGALMRGWISLSRALSLYRGTSRIRTPPTPARTNIELQA